MPNPDLERLRGIKTFPSLVKYLREDLDWPIETDNFDDLTFDFEPEELGIDPKTSAKIESIKQLRPLASNQPWGIFFVKFEPKKLPVVALRRILGQLVIKKRASANRADQQTWRLSDLLFLSNYGENEQRQITFAHFSGNDDSKNLPTLKVLGWDDSDTPLHIGHVHTTLRDKLRWPGDDPDLDIWRESWSSAFTLRHGEVIKTSKELAVRLASLAQKIRKRANSILSIETESGPLRKLMAGFKEALIHDLTEDAFADMYAQTIAYGLLSARITNPKGNNPDELFNQMPITNPFLKELMESFLSVGGRKGKSGKGVGIDFDELGINEVVDLLDNSNMEAVIRDFGDRNPLEDPVIHFYELFLKEYDSKQKVKRGVFYTPQPVVSFIVRSVDEALRTKFGLENGLADTTTWGAMAEKNMKFEIPKGSSPDDPFVQIIDPATGTGTFLVEVIDLIYKTMIKKWKGEGNSERTISELWNKYVPKHLLPRLHGYEILMAPYTIAHLKIGLALYETGYRFDSGERVHVYLTNALEPPNDKQLTLDFLPALAHEAKSVNTIKSAQRFTVVIGNPPYSAMSANLSNEVRSIIDPYRFVNGKRIKEKSMLRLEMQLQDDYIKFIRFSQILIERAGGGVFGLIVNHSFIDNPTLRGLRSNLCETYSEVHIADLHGNARKKNDTPQGVENQNVFDIQQGVAILMGKRFGSFSSPTVFHADVYGNRADKYKTMLDDSRVNWRSITPTSPFYFLFGQDNEEIGQEFESFLALPEIMPQSSGGIMSGRDKFAFDFDRSPLVSRISEFCDETQSDEWVRSKFEIKDASGYKLKNRRRIVIGKSPESFIMNAQYRPFDYRYVAYSSGFLTADQSKIMSHLTGRVDNLGLIATRQTKEPWGVFVTKAVIERKFVANYDPSTIFPLFLAFKGFEDSSKVNQAANLSQSAVNAFGFLGDLLPNSSENIRSFFDFIYGILHSKNYRKRYARNLSVNYPRIPVPKKQKLYSSLSVLGKNLVSLHLLESLKVNDFTTTYFGPENPEISRVGWSNGNVWLDASKVNAREHNRATKSGTIGFRGIPEETWNFHIGGYQVCHKWLKDRGPKKGKPGRILTKEDIDHYQKIIVAISETIRIMAEIDEVIEEHGGWPGAFVTE